MTSENERHEDEKMRKMAELRTTLEKRVQELQAELEEFRTLLDFVNSFLLEKGFKKPEVTKPVPPTPRAEEIAPAGPPLDVEKAAAPPSFPEETQAIPIKTATGDLLADLYMDEDSMRIILAKDKQFTVDTPPFMAFLIERVLAKMQEKDRESAAAGEIPPEKILSYEIVKDGDVVRELSIKNIGSDRARELKSTIRWTLEKMHEKIRSTP